MNHSEEMFARSFIVPEKRERYLSLLQSKKGRDKLRERFYHHPDLDPRFAHLVPAGQQSSTSIERLLRSKGAPDTCWVMSTNDEIDGREMKLAEALEEVAWYCDDGTLLSCIPGRLAYFELAEPGERYILER